jgi:biotin carboxyl carrier protein
MVRQTWPWAQIDPAGRKVKSMPNHVTSPIAGKLITRLVNEGDTINAETEIAVIEAMKMHIPVSAERTGRVVKWLVVEQSTVAEGQALLQLEG